MKRLPEKKPGTILKRRKYFGRITKSLDVTINKLPQKVEQLLLERESLVRSYRLLRKNTLPYRLESIINNKKIIKEISLVSAILDIDDKSELRTAGDLLKEKIKSGIIILGATLKEDKIILIVMLTDDLIHKGYDAGKIIAPLAQALRGKGGGKRHYAQAGGTGHSKLRDLFQNIEQYIQI